GGATFDTESYDPPPQPSPTRGEGADRVRRTVLLKLRDCSLNSTRLGRNPASVLPAPVGAISSTERPARALASSSSWCARGVQPRPANQRANAAGNNAASPAAFSTSCLAVWLLMVCFRTASELALDRLRHI